MTQSQNPLLGLSAGKEVVRPSEVISPSGTTTSTEGPCPFCGTMRLDNPTGAQWDASWHCWKCGYQPSVTSGVSQWEQRRQFEAFQQWLASQMTPDTSHPTLNAPPPTTADATVVADMQKQITELQAAITASKQGG